MLLGSAGRSTSWAHELDEGDIFFSAPGLNFDAVFGERSNVAGISITPQHIASMFAGEPMLSDVGFWTQNHQYACPPHERAALVARVTADRVLARSGTGPVGHGRRFLAAMPDRGFYVDVCAFDAARHRRNDPVDIEAGARSGALSRHSFGSCGACFRNLHHLWRFASDAASRVSRRAGCRPHHLPAPQPSLLGS